MRFASVTLLAGAAFAQFPETPQPQPKPVHVYTFRTSWQNPPLRTNKQVFKSKYFWISEITSFGAMAIACSRKDTHEHWDSELPAWGAQVGLYYLASRYIDEIYGIGGAAYQTGHYIHSAMQ
jgi:hypothetical protein